MQTVLHIGQHKTGTTSLQQYLQDRKAELAERGFHVPTGVIGSSASSHWPLNVYALEAGRSSFAKDAALAKAGQDYIDTMKVRLEAEIGSIYNEAVQRGCQQVLWSNEGLYLLNSKEEYLRILRLFSPHSSEIHVLCCFRDVAAFRESYRNQLRRSGLPFSDDPDSYRYTEPDSWLFDYDRKKELLQSVFEHCTFFPYDPNDNTKAFLSILGIDDMDTGEYRLNPS